MKPKESSTTKTIENTTYIIVSLFQDNSSESILKKLERLLIYEVNNR